MSELKPGDRVRVADRLSAEGWSGYHNAHRHPGATGELKELHTPLTTAGEPWWTVLHDDGSRGCYHDHELTRLEAEQPVSLVGAEQVQPSELQTLRELRRGAQRLLSCGVVFGADRGAYEAVRGALQTLRGALQTLDAIANDEPSPDPGLEAEAKQPRVRPSELQALRALRRAAEQWRRKQEPTIYAHVPDRSEVALWDALQTLDEIDAGGSGPIPDTPAPPPSDAGEAVLQLRARVEELEQERDGLRARNAAALETLRDAFALRPNCQLITDAAYDAASEFTSRERLADAASRIIEEETELRRHLTVDESTSTPLLELAQLRVEEGAITRKLRELDQRDLGSIIDGLEQLTAAAEAIPALTSYLAQLLPDQPREYELPRC